MGCLGAFETGLAPGPPCCGFIMTSAKCFYGEEAGKQRGRGENEGGSAGATDQRSKEDDERPPSPLFISIPFSTSAAESYRPMSASPSAAFVHKTLPQYKSEKWLTKYGWERYGDGWKMSSPNGDTSDRSLRVLRRNRTSAWPSYSALEDITPILMDNYRTSFNLTLQFRDQKRPGTWKGPTRSPRLH